MAISDTALRILTEARQHPLRLATPPMHLPATACNAVLYNLVESGYVEEDLAPFENINLGERQQHGACAALRVCGSGEPPLRHRQGQCGSCEIECRSWRNVPRHNPDVVGGRGHRIKLDEAGRSS
ncbi:hypothetical protein [Roseicella sp. DB1501]|uniref:hypothetical protein n=1 Tax=Roseicella sp. DB1501 TaxID=2730925 RepID=UPI0014923BC1|nr:hypothetical protein [Roseicella sp. DB1501]NOG71265.1 hypothetical protein [Roseicella sp. DB1501]